MSGNLCPLIFIDPSKNIHFVFRHIFHFLETKAIEHDPTMFQIINPIKKARLSRLSLLTCLSCPMWLIHNQCYKRGDQGMSESESNSELGSLFLGFCCDRHTKRQNVDSTISHHSLVHCCTRLSVWWWCWSTQRANALIDTDHLDGQL